MRRELAAAVVMGMGLAIFVPPTALAMPEFRSPFVETSLEKVGYLRRQSRRYWRNGYAYYPPAYGSYLPPPAYAYYPHTVTLRLRHQAVPIHRTMATASTRPTTVTASTHMRTAIE